MVRLLSCSAVVGSLLMGGLAGCAAKRSPPVRGEAADAVDPIVRDWPGTKGELKLYQALAVRDPEPVCAEVEGLVDDPVASLTMIAEDIEMPPWAGIRAASCLAFGHAEAAEETLRSWMVDPDRRGLVLVVLQHVDTMAEAVAVEIVRDALDGPFAEDAVAAAEGSERPAVRALLER